MTRIYYFLILAFLFSFKAFAENITNPFYNAIDNKSFGLIESLIASGTDINMQDQSGKTALMHAAQKSSPDIVNFLIQNGANVNAKTLNDVMALHYAARNKKSEIVKILIDNGAQINAQDFSGFTPLMRAVTNDNFDNFEILLISNSNPYLKNNNDKDTIDLVISNSDKKMFSFLIEPLNETHRLDLIKINQKLVSESNKHLNKIFEKKSIAISNTVLAKIANYMNDQIEFEIVLDTEFADVADYPCYKIINNDVSLNSCITVADEIADRDRKLDDLNEPEIVKDISDNDANVETNIPVEASASANNVVTTTKVDEPKDIEELQNLQEIEMDIIDPIDMSNAVLPVAAVAIVNPVVPEVIANNEVKQESPKRVQVSKSFYKDLAKQYSVSADDIAKNFSEINYLAMTSWAFNKANPTELIKYNLIYNFYNIDIATKADVKMNQSYIQDLKKQEDAAKLLAVTPVIKQSDKMKEQGFYIQSGSFIYPKNSTKLKKNLGKYGNVFIVERLVKKRNFHVVYVGPFKSKNEALSISKKADFQKMIGTESIIRNF